MVLVTPFGLVSPSSAGIIRDNTVSRPILFMRVGSETQMMIARSESFVHAVTLLRNMSDATAQPATAKLAIIAKDLRSSELRIAGNDIDSLVQLQAPDAIISSAKALKNLLKDHQHMSETAAEMQRTDPDSAKVFAEIDETNRVSQLEDRIRSLTETWMNLSETPQNTWCYHVASVMADAKIASESSADLTSFRSRCVALVKSAPPGVMSAALEAVRRVGDANNRASIDHKSEQLEVLQDANDLLKLIYIPQQTTSRSL